jgi:tetratricopeptide (TPR) repeat protein
MDCRKTLVLALGLLIGVGGCTYPFARSSVNPPTSGNEPEPMTHKASTYVAFGDFRAAAGFASENSPAQQKQFREDAKQAYLKALEIDSKHMPAYLALARLLQGCDDQAGAVAVFERALQVSGQDPALWHELGMCHCRAKNWSTAIEGLQKACLLDPNNKPYSTALAFALARAGRYDESYAALRRLSSEAKAHYDLARMLRHLDQIDLARKHVMIALQKDPKQPGAKALLDELNSKASAQQPSGIQQVGYNQPAARTRAAATGQASDAVGRPIRLPPLPVISIRSMEQPAPQIIGPS